jgi:SAM-dependent methyltransferase
MLQASSLYSNRPLTTYTPGFVHAGFVPLAPTDRTTCRGRGREPKSMARELIVDPVALRDQVKDKYRTVAVDPHRTFHFHTGRPLASRLGYEQEAVDALPDRAVESFAGVGNPFSLRRLVPGERVVDVGSGAGFDSFIAAGQVGPAGSVVGVDMTPEMLDKSRATARALGLGHVEFREGLAEAIPVDDGWADVVISNGVINLCADKQAVFAEIRRVLRPGGALQFADIANGRPVPPEALRDIDLWTG